MAAVDARPRAARPGDVGGGGDGRPGAVPGGAGGAGVLEGVRRGALAPWCRGCCRRAFSLVKANSRVTLAGLLATGVAAPIGAGLHQIGSAWPLYGAFVVFVLGTFLSFSLPHKVDSAKGEHKAQLASGVVSLRKVSREEEAERRGTGAAARAENRGRVRTQRADRQLRAARALRLPDLLPRLPAAGAAAERSLGRALAGAGGGRGRRRKRAGDGHRRMAEGTRPRSDHRVRAGVRAGRGRHRRRVLRDGHDRRGRRHRRHRARPWASCRWTR